jgi:hypothetical protein
MITAARRQAVEGELDRHPAHRHPVHQDQESDAPPVEKG